MFFSFFCKELANKMANLRNVQWVNGQPINSWPKDGRDEDGFPLHNQNENAVPVILKVWSMAPRPGSERRKKKKSDKHNKSPPTPKTE